MKDRLNRNPQSEIDSSDLVHIPRNKIVKVFCQNIGGIRDKTNELIYFLPPKLLQNLCIKEHVLERIAIDHYNLGAKCFRRNLKDSGVRVFVHKSLNFLNIKLLWRDKY
jgi:hypothetical protein